MIERNRVKARRRRWPWVVFGMPVVAATGAVLLLTDGAPAAGDATAAPDAWQAVAAQGVLRNLRDAASGGGPVVVEADAAELAAVAAVANSALRPDRVALAADAFGLHVTGSRPLPMGRWLNLGISTGQGGDGPPPVTVRVGSVTLPPALARLAMAAGVRLLRARGFEVPDPEAAVRRLRVADGHAMAEIDLAGGGQLARAAAGVLRGGGGAAGAFCRLAADLRQRPGLDMAGLVRRAFAAPAEGDLAQANRDTLVALTMLVVDRRVGLLGGVTPQATRDCAGSAADVTIHGRNDSPKHWLVSAALAVTTGAQLSTAAGEWKELADSVTDQGAFRHGDASGFSLADIGADRAGELIGLAAVDPARAGAVREALARADDETLLPRDLLAMGDGMSAEQFARTYGSTGDARFARVRARIDAIIRARTPAGR